MQKKSVFWPPYLSVLAWALTERYCMYIQSQTKAVTLLVYLNPLTVWYGSTDIKRLQKPAENDTDCCKASASMVWTPDMYLRLKLADVNTWVNGLIWPKTFPCRGSYVVRLQPTLKQDIYEQGNAVLLIRLWLMKNIGLNPSSWSWYMTPPSPSGRALACST